MQARIKEQINTLVSLQEIESRKTGLTESLVRISNRLDELDRQLEALRETIAEEQRLALEAHKQYRSLEIDLQQNQTLIKKSQNRLALVKNSREYQALMKEVEDLKAANGRIEEQMLALMNQQEQSTEQLAQLQQEEKVLAAAVAQEKDHIQTEQHQHRQDMERLEAQWQAVAASLNLDMMNKFKRLKEQRQTRGIAIVPVENAVCRGCNVNLPPQAFNELKRCDSIKFCPNCQRMIYWKQPEAEA